MRICAVEPLVLHVSAKTNWFFIKVSLADGAQGIGEASLNGWEEPMLAYLAQLGRTILGESIERVTPLLTTYPSSPGGLVAASVRSALAQALLDAEARSRGVPLHALLGPKVRDTVRVYANINRATVDRSPEGCARSAANAARAGFTAVKIAPFDGVRREAIGTAATSRLIEAGVERVHAIRAAIGNDTALMIDCHWRFDEAAALHTLERLALARLLWFECPVPEGPLWYPAMQRIRAAANAAGILLAGAETQTAVDGFRPLIEAGALDVIMPDVKYAGGPRTMLDIARVAHAHGVTTSPHNPTGPVCTFASLHVAACAEELPWLELQVGESALYDEVVHGRQAAFVNGAFVIPDGPGIGVEIDEAVVRAHRYVPVPAGPEEQLG